MINLGIIGLGGIATFLHVPQANASGKFFVKAAADVYMDDRKAKDMNIPEYYTDYKEMLRDPGLDAILVASPHHCHEEHCIASFEAGKHVLIEKPISRNLREATNIIKAAEKAGTVGMIGFCERYEKVHMYIKDLINNDIMGKLLSARIDHYQNFNPAEGSWWRDREKVGGGAVIGSGVHRLDLLRWYFGEAVSVYAKATLMPKRLEAEACVHAVIEFENGVITNFSINWASYDYLYYEGLSISGENGLVVTGPANKIGLAQVDNGTLKDFEAPVCPSMYEHFAECIEKKQKPLTDLEEGYKTLQLARAIYQSIEIGEPVNPQHIDF